MDITSNAGLNVRSGPGMVYGVVGGVDSGTKMTSNEFKKDGGGTGWYKVDNGWVCSNYVTSSAQPSTNSSGFHNIVTTTGVNVRSGPGLNYDTVGSGYDAGTVSSPTDYQKDSDGNGWYKTNDGWVREDNIYVDSGGMQTTGEDGATASSNIQQSIKDGATTGTVDNPNGGLMGGGGVGSEGGDVVLKKRIFGAPYQFLSTTDIRPDDGNSDSELGVSFIEMMSEAPILSVIPGKPMFLPDLNEEEKAGVVSSFNELIGNMGNRLEDAASQALDSKNMDVRYFEFVSDHTTYIRYVNTLCQTCAILMGIGDEYVPGYEGGDDKYKFKYYDWSGYRLSNVMAGRQSSGILGSKESDAETTANVGKDIWKHYTQDGIAGAMETAMTSMNLEEYYMDFYVNPSISYSETFSNTTKESMVASMVSNASEWAKELSFLMSSGAVSAENVGKSNEKFAQELNQGFQKNFGGNGKGFISRFISGATSIISGSNISFPELWMNSDFNRSYNIEIDLKTPYGRKKNIFLDLFVPMWHWVALTAPRQSTVNTYSAPFLVRCYVPGMFSTDMGIVENLTVQKGGDGSAWSVDGYPLEIKLSIGIKDLYNTFSISYIHSRTDAYNFLWNHALIDYISVQSGLNMKQSEYLKKIEVAKALAQNAVTDWIQFPQDKIREVLARGMRVAGGKT